MTEKERDNKHWQIITSYLEQATPVEQVHFARWTNYTDTDILKWFIDQPQMDVIAAMTIYFQSAPDYYSELALEEMQNYELDTVDFLNIISNRVKNGFYKSSDIAFNGKDFLDENYNFQTAKREIPKHMQKVYKGSIEISFDIPEGFDEGLPNIVSKEIWTLFDNEIIEK